MSKRNLLKLASITGLLSCMTLSHAEGINNEQPGTAGLTGTYLGKYSLTMNTQDENAMNMLQLPHTTLGESEYIVLGNSIADSVWQWDFDNHQIIWGGGNLFAMGMVKTPFQPYNQNLLEEKSGQQDIFPEIKDVNDITIGFVDNADGTYTAHYAKKIHLQMQGYPISLAKTTFKVTSKSDGTLEIITVDDESTEERLDGVPGTQISGVFPYVVQPQYDSAVMYKNDDTDQDQDGISDLKETLLGLDLADTNIDKDISDDVEELGVFARPLDSDHDGIADIFEVNELSQQPDVISGLILNSANTVTLDSKGDISFIQSYASELDISLQLGETLQGEAPALGNVEGTPYVYSVVNFFFDVLAASDKTELAYTLTFENAIPDGFTLMDKQLLLGFDMDTRESTRSIVYVELPWQANAENANAIDFNLPVSQEMSSDRKLVIGTLQEQKVPDTEVDADSKTTTEQTNDSSDSHGLGSFGANLIVLMGSLLMLRRRNAKK